MKTVCVSGYFDPLHIGHIRYLEEARSLGDKLVVIVNNDHQAGLKKGGAFMPEDERLEIISALKCVSLAVLATDKDRTVKKTLAIIRPQIFAKGGDSTPENVPELDVCQEHNIEVRMGIGGAKIQSSSWLLHGKS